MAIKFLATIIAVLATHALAQQTYPAKAVRFVVPYAAGGSVDPLVRLFTVKLTETFGQPMIVDLRPGGNTIIGTELVAKAAPDGYTFLVMTVSCNSTRICWLTATKARDTRAITNLDRIASRRKIKVARLSALSSIPHHRI